MNTGDRIKMFSDSDALAYMRLAASYGFRSSYKNGYVTVGKAYKDPIDKKTFAERIIRERKKLKLDQDEFAEYLGVSKTTIYNWELGNRLPGEYNRQQLKKIIGFEVEEI